MNKQHEKGFRNINLHMGVPADENWPYDSRPTSPNARQFGWKAPKFEKHIFIRKDQILFDIDSQIGMLATARKKPDGTQDDSLTNATTTFKAQFTRWINEHIGLAKGFMSAFVLEKTRETDMNALKDVEEVDITLLMPDFWDDTVFEQLTAAVHSFIVNGVLTRFFMLTLTSKDPVTIDMQQQTDDAVRQVKKYVNSNKPGTIRKTQHPF